MMNEENRTPSGNGLSRRTFLKSAAAGVAMVGVSSMLPMTVQAGPKDDKKPADPVREKKAKKMTVNDFPTEAQDYPIDKLNQFGTYYVGMWQGKVALTDQTERTYKIYVPENCRRDASCYYIAVPENVETTDFLQKSGWIELADKDKVVLSIFEPAGKKWGTSATEADYFAKAYSQFSGTTYVYHDIFNWRWVGYGKGGEHLQRYIMNNPMACAAAAIIDGSEGITGNELKAIGATKFVASKNVLDVSYGEAPVPVYLVNAKSGKNAKAVIEYWKSVNDVADEKIELAEGYEYHQKPFSTRLFTYEHKCADVRVWEHPVTYTDCNLTRKAYDFVNRYARSGSGSPYSNSLTRSVNDDYFTRTEKVIDGYQREWFTALPTSYDPKGEPMPLVIFYHGTGQSGLLASRQGDWWKVGEEKGFISVCPSASLEKKRSPGKVPQMSWNVEGYGNADDVVFTKALIDYMIANYNVDPGRVYVTGQSNGGRMSIYAGLALPHDVTAVGSAGASSLLTNTTSNEYYLPDDTDESAIVPFLATLGQFDVAALDPFVEGNDCWQRYQYLTRRYNLEYNDVFTYSNCRNDYIRWQTKGGCALLEQIAIGLRAHSHRPAENWIIWNEWFAFFHRDPATGKLYYMNREVVLD